MAKADEKNDVPAPQKAAPANDDAVKAALTLPDGDVLIRRVAGPDGTHPWLGYVKRGRVYTVNASRAVSLCFPRSVDPRSPARAEFEPVFTGDRTALEAAAKDAAKSASGKN